MAAHPTHPPRPSREQVEQALSTLDFPLTKEELIRCLTDATSDPDGAVLREVRALPLATYGSAAEVLGSVEVADQRGP